MMKAMLPKMDQVGGKEGGLGGLSGEEQYVVA